MVEKEENSVLTLQADLCRLAIGDIPDILPEAEDAGNEECCSDSGKGGSEILTPAESITEGGSEIATTAESITESTDSGTPAPWHLCPAYNAFTAYSETMGAVMPWFPMIYEFEIPQMIVGRLIGKYGAFVNRIKGRTRANLIIKRHHLNPAMKICAVEGLCDEIQGAIKMIREHFPLKRYPCLSLGQLNHQRVIEPGSSSISFLPPNNKLNLIEGVVNDVAISSIISVDHLFVQQPTHPTFPALSRLHQTLLSFYESLPEVAPKLVRPFNVGVICVARLGEGDWCRAEVVSLQEGKEEVIVRLVDGGGYVVLPIEELRQIRFDFVTIPFQGSECRLAGVTPLDPNTLELGEEAQAYFDSICQGQVLQALVAGYSLTTNDTLIYLYRMGEDQIPVLVNQELVEKGLASAVDYSASLGPSSDETEMDDGTGSHSIDEETVVDDTGSDVEVERFSIM